jgi:hypothetical protein
MYFFYGNYTHPNGEVLLTNYVVRSVKSPTRNERFFSEHEMHLRVDIQLTQAESASAFNPNPQIERVNRQLLFNAKIANLVDVYSLDYQSCGFLHDDGSPTRHYLSMSHPDNVSGNYMLLRSWPLGANGDEYSTVRTATIIIGAVFDTSVSGLYQYNESVRLIGTGGRDWEWVINNLAAPTQQDIARFTPQIIIQSGRIVGGPTWALGNVPPPLFPAWEKQVRRVQDYQTPRWMGNQHRLYGYDWSYYMVAPAGQVAIPNIY